MATATADNVRLRQLGAGECTSPGLGVVGVGAVGVSAEEI